MKPIFEDEKLFLEKKLKVRLPNYCWRHGSKIYLNCDTKPAIIEFKVENGIMLLKKNRLIKINNNTCIIEVKKNKNKEIKNLTLLEEYEKKKQYLMELREESLDKTYLYIILHSNYEKRISMSGGKDSDMMLEILKEVFNELGITNVRDRVGYTVNDFIIKDTEYIFDVFNTTNDTADTYKHIKNDIDINIKDIHTPEKGWYRWLSEDKNWFLPSAMVRNCCSHFKEGNLNKLLDKKKKYILFVGMRKYESAKRASYDWDLNETVLNKNIKKLNVPMEWRRFLPIVNFKDEDVWLMLMFYYKIKLNKMYQYGYNRCGCLICPYASNYTDLLTNKYYPNLINRWKYALDKNYELYDVKNRLKWTKEEWINGKWKQGTSKEYELISLKPTDERIKELADIKGISKEMAKKYFKRKCKKCNKNLNPDEIAMNFKLFGRYEGQEDNRGLLCKKCICEQMEWTGKQYQEKVWEFRNSGCNLF